MRLQTVSRAAGCQGAAMRTNTDGRRWMQQGWNYAERLWLQRMTITGSRSRQSPGPTEPSQGCSSRTSRRAPEGLSNAFSLSWSLTTTALSGILSPEPPSSAALFPPIHCPGTKHHFSRVLEMLFFSFFSILFSNWGMGEIAWEKPEIAK